VKGTPRARSSSPPGSFRYDRTGPSARSSCTSATRSAELAPLYATAVWSALAEPPLRADPLANAMIGSPAQTGLLWAALSVSEWHAHVAIYGPGSSLPMVVPGQAGDVMRAASLARARVIVAGSSTGVLCAESLVISSLPGIPETSSAACEGSLAVCGSPAWGS
jgi:hypothetical protein